MKYVNLSRRERDYFMWLKVVSYLDRHLTRGTRHYRNEAGVLLTSLDEVIRAIIAGELRVVA